MDHELEQSQRAELLAQRLSDDELRAVLQRLGEDEFLFDTPSSIGDIVEATGADPVMVGRALAEIRDATVEEQFGDVLEEHEKRISELEHKRPAAKKTKRKPVLPVEVAEAEDRLHELGMVDLQEGQKLYDDNQGSGPFVWLVVVAAIMFLLFVARLLSTLPATQDPFSSYASPTVPNWASTSEKGEIFVHGSNGKLRPATDQERMFLEPHGDQRRPGR